MASVASYSDTSSSSSSDLDELNDQLSSVDLNKDASQEFAFLDTRDQLTLSFIRSSRIMFINRGLPGSGKSTLSRRIDAEYGAVICAGDDFFTDPTTGEYNFVAEKLGEAHASARQKCEDACNAARSPIIVDNTNVTFWECKPYLALAGQHNYIVLMVEPRTSWKFDVKTLAASNKHGVPEQVIAARLKAYHVFVPFYFGWFVNHTQSAQLVDLAQRILDECSTSAVHPQLFRACKYSNVAYNQKKHQM